MNKVNNVEFYLVNLAYNPYLVVTFEGEFKGAKFKLSDYNEQLDSHDYTNSNTNNYELVTGNESESREIFNFCCDQWADLYKKQCAIYLARELIKIDDEDLFYVEYSGHFSTLKTIEFIANFAGIDTDELLNSSDYELQDVWDDYSEFTDHAINVNNTIIDKIIEKLENLE